MLGAPWRCITYLINFKFSDSHAQSLGHWCFFGSFSLFFLFLFVYSVFHILSKHHIRESTFKSSKNFAGGMRDPCSADRESGIQYPESGIQCVGCRIQDCLGSPYIGQYLCRGVNEQFAAPAQRRGTRCLELHLGVVLFFSTFHTNFYNISNLTANCAKYLQLK